MTKETYFQFRVSKEELAQIKEAAKVLNMPAAQYAREVLLVHASAFTSGDREKMMRVLINFNSQFLAKWDVAQDT